MASRGWGPRPAKLLVHSSGQNRHNGVTLGQSERASSQEVSEVGDYLRPRGVNLAVAVGQRLLEPGNFVAHNFAEGRAQPEGGASIHVGWVILIERARCVFAGIGHLYDAEVRDSFQSSQQRSHGGNGGRQNRSLASESLAYGSLHRPTVGLGSTASPFTRSLAR